MTGSRRLVLLLAAVAAVPAVLGLVVGLIFGGPVVGLLAGLVVGIALVGLAWWRAEALTVSMTGARPADPVEHARLLNLLDGLGAATGLARPAAYVVPDEAPNALAVGRSPRSAAVLVTTGLLDQLRRVELEGVLAHELSHIKNYDILVSTLAVTMVGIIALVSDFAIRFMWWGGGRRSNSDRDSNGAGVIIALVGFALLLLAPLIAKVMQLAISRRRESLADFSGVEMTRYPPGLISALEKLEADQTVVHSGSKATAHLWIEQPIARNEQEGRMSRINRLFDTHPPLEERIAALREL